MPKQKGKGNLLAKIGAAAKKAYEGHKDDETTLSGAGELPAGIENGVAQVVLCKFDTFKQGDNAGEVYFMSQAVVKHPKDHEGVPIEGLRTQIGPEPLCDTPNRSRKTIDDHMGWVLNQIRLLGVDTKDVPWEDIEGIVQAIEEEQPYVRFRTWKGQATKQFPNPRVNHEWRGLVKEFSEDGASDSVKDETDEDKEEEEATVGLDGGAADDGDEDAQRAIVEAAEACGIDPEDKKFKTWASVVAAIEKATASTDEEAEEEEEEEEEAEEEEEEAEEEEEEEEEEEFVPEKGTVCFFKPKGKKKRIECEVTAVFGNSRKVNLKNLDDGKTLYKSIPWDALEVE